MVRKQLCRPGKTYGTEEDLMGVIVLCRRIKEQVTRTFYCKGDIGSRFFRHHREADWEIDRGSLQPPAASRSIAQSSFILLPSAGPAAACAVFPFAFAVFPPFWHLRSPGESPAGAPRSIPAPGARRMIRGRSPMQKANRNRRNRKNINGLRPDCDPVSLLTPYHCCATPYHFWGRQVL